MGKPRLRLRPQTNSVELEERFATGKDPAALLEMIAIACGIGFPFPGWAKKGFWEAWAKALRGELRSWNEVFGRPPTALEARRFNREMANRDKIWNMVAKAKAKGRGIGNALFDEIGREVGINGTDVGRLYKEQCRFRGTPTKPRKLPV